MENEKNKRAGIGQKPRGRQQTRGIEALPSEKPVASNEGQEEGVKDPVSETADRVQEGGGLLEEISTISDKTAENEKIPSVAVLEGQSLEEMLAKSKQENPVMGGLRRATPEEEEAFKQQAAARAVRNEPIVCRTLTGEELDSIPVSGGFIAERLMSKEEAHEVLDSISRRVDAALHPKIGEQPDGSFNVILRLEEGYIEAVRQWAEAEGLSVEEWVARQFSHYLETWGQPAKSR